MRKPLPLPRPETSVQVIALPRARQRTPWLCARRPESSTEAKKFQFCAQPSSRLVLATEHVLTVPSRRSVALRWLGSVSSGRPAKHDDSAEASTHHTRPSADRNCSSGRVWLAL